MILRKAKELYEVAAAKAKESDIVFKGWDNESKWWKDMFLAVADHALSGKRSANGKKVVYVSGPMTGIPAFNYPEFNRAAERLRALGYDVVNPAESHGGRTDLPRDQYIRRDICSLMNVDIICMLPGWERSSGAALEYAIAQELKLTVWSVDGSIPPEAAA